ncbi:aminodeoxychorismate lyase [Kitasatospora sp. NPDC094015]|uniref:aminodeoxychorismate lyase n=1 Tax=Kitasatospora sp. NPDC094015 TaxID=3155205 RepID=UPI0033227879
MSGGTLVRLDGTVADRGQPLLRADDLGALRGDGVFEALIVVNGRPWHLDEHLARLERSAATLGLRAPDAGVWRRCLDTAIAQHGAAGEAYARLVLTRGPEDGSGPETGYLLLDEVPGSTLQARAEGVRVITLARGLVAAPPERAPWLLAGAKTLSYAVNMAAQRWARQHDADEVVFLAADGTVLEAPTAAVVVARGRTLLSPGPELGILPSIALAGLFAAAGRAGWECRHAGLTTEDLRTADGLWLVSSVRLAARVRSLDGLVRAPGPYDEEIAALARVTDADAVPC